MMIDSKVCLKYLSEIKICYFIHAVIHVFILIVNGTISFPIPFSERDGYLIELWTVWILIYDHIAPGLSSSTFDVSLVIHLTYVFCFAIILVLINRIIFKIFSIDGMDP